VAAAQPTQGGLFEDSLPPPEVGDAAALECVKISGVWESRVIESQTQRATRLDAAARSLVIYRDLIAPEFFDLF
jgi:hypothetical protein